MGTIRYGSKGSDVTTLQTMLNQLGYGLATDGNFGRATETAVRDYQARNGLAIDGIAGANTWGKLNTRAGTAQTPQQAQNVAGGGSISGFTQAQPTYAESDTLKNAADELANVQGRKPGEYVSSYGDQIQGMLDQMLNRPSFSYDFSADPLYMQYADQYQRMGNKAMQSAMGDASALTGGYGNSYAQQVGQQTYQGYLENMNAVIPELQNAAYNRYMAEGERIRGDMGMLMGLENSQYGRYRDSVGDYRDDLNYATGRYDTQSEREYGRHLNDMATWQNARDFAYQQEMDKIEQANWEKEYNLAVSKAAKAAKSGGGKGKNWITSALEYLDKQVTAGKLTYDEADSIAYSLIYGGTEKPKMELPSDFYGVGTSKNKGKPGHSPTSTGLRPGRPIIMEK